MSTCVLYGTTSPFISRELGVCLRCIREQPGSALPIAAEAHVRSREPYGLPPTPPRSAEGVSCNFCVNGCRIPDGVCGYCGVMWNRHGKLCRPGPLKGSLSWYLDPLPTNCVADRVCPGGTGAGFPKFAYRQGPEHGSKNLAVFFEACSFDCLYCQNWHFKRRTVVTPAVSMENLVAAVDEKTACVCHFGGDPTPQLPFALHASRAMRKRCGDRILRICWETNGCMHPVLLDQMVSLSLASGGCMKFDLKAWNRDLHVSLTGITNERTIGNFRRAAESIPTRPSPPLLIASTLLVPGYIDEEEVGAIARFIASLSPDIPYSLLAFYPHFFMSDLPLTPRSLAERCMHAAHAEGLRRVTLGNAHLLAGPEKLTKPPRSA